MPPITIEGLKEFADKVIEQMGLKITTDLCSEAVLSEVFTIDVFSIFHHDEGTWGLYYIKHHYGTEEIPPEDEEVELEVSSNPYPLIRRAIREAFNQRLDAVFEGEAMSLEHEEGLI
jgi:hypothetical protein